MRIIGGQVKRFVGAVMEALTSQAVSMLALWISAAAFGLGALPDTSSRVFLLGVAGGLVAVVLLKVATRWWEYRFENETQTRRISEMRLGKDGTEITYRTTKTIRARTKNLRDTAIRLSWTGETLTPASTTIEPIGRGYTMSVEAQGADGRDADVIFQFDQPLRRWRKITVGVEITMDEPHRTYQPMMSINAAAGAWSMFSSLEFRVTWDQTAPVEFDSIEGRVLRSTWDRQRRTTNPMAHLKPDRLKTVESGRRWKILPVRSDRVYDLRFRLREFA